jgi:hypothetical protein
MSTSRSTFYNSFLGETKNKFNNSNRRSDSIAEPTFFAWTSKNMYRTSYNDMSKRVSITKIFNSLQYLGRVCRK